MFSIKTIVILSFLGLLTFVFAEMSIDQQISAIKTASPEQRVQMMNNLKRNIATMHASQRTETINKLRANLSHHKVASSTQLMYSNGDQNKQINNTNEMQHSEIMMQKGAADRFVQEYNSAPISNQPPPTHETSSTHNDFSNNWRK